MKLRNKQPTYPQPQGDPRKSHPSPRPVTWGDETEYYDIRVDEMTVKIDGMIEQRKLLIRARDLAASYPPEEKAL